MGRRTGGRVVGHINNATAVSGQFAVVERTNTHCNFDGRHLPQNVNNRLHKYRLSNKLPTLNTKLPFMQLKTAYIHDTFGGSNILLVI